MSRKNEAWLGYKNSCAVCLVCAEDPVQALRSRFGRCTASFLRMDNLRRHPKFPCHTQALLSWGERSRAEATNGIVSSFSLGSSASADSTAATAALAVSTKTRRSTDGYRAVVGLRTLLETSGSFRDFDKWLDALVGEDRQALESEWHCK